MNTREMYNELDAIHARIYGLMDTVYALGEQITQRASDSEEWFILYLELQEISLLLARAYRTLSLICTNKVRQNAS